MDRERVEQVRRFWDADAATYDRDPGHYPVSPLERAAWRATLEKLLPAAPARVPLSGFPEVACWSAAVARSKS